MNPRRFSLILLVGAVALATVFLRQRREVQTLRSQLSSPVSTEAAEREVQKVPQQTGNAPPVGTSTELFRLRGEVTLLRRELAEAAPNRLSKQQMLDDWNLVHSGLKPSDLPGFVHFNTATNYGFSTPDAAFQSFNHALRNQQKERLTETRMKDLWDVPDDFDQPPGYNIDLGEGMGGEIGYRIVHREQIATNQVQLTVDYETPDGGSFRREKIMVNHNGHWRMKPVSVTRPAPKPE